MIHKDSRHCLATLHTKYIEYTAKLDPQLCLRRFYAQLGQQKMYKRHRFMVLLSYTSRVKNISIQKQIKMNIY